MGHWGTKSYENDTASDAIDTGLEYVHGAAYEALMDDRNPVGFEQAQRQLVSPATLAAALDALRTTIGTELDWDDWDDLERLAYAGVVVRHAEFGVTLPIDVRDRALQWLESEDIDWEDATLRGLRRDKERNILKTCATTSPTTS